MMMLDGRPLARSIRAAVRNDALAYRQQGIVPMIAIVTATEDQDAVWYVRAICKAAKACELDTQLITLAPNATSEQIARSLQSLAVDPAVHGIILQTPLPDGVNGDQLVSLIPPAKDIDGVNPLSAGRLWYGLEAFAPATAEAVLAVLDHYKIPLVGKHAVIVGRSRVVGKPVASLLLQQDATVTICHSKTTDLADRCREAQILVVAVGQPGIVGPAMVSTDTYVIDVGTTVQGADTLVGDVDPGVATVAAGLTPVPGGIGPVTTALILQHTLTSVKLLAPSSSPLQS